MKEPEHVIADIKVGFTRILGKRRIITMAKKENQGDRIHRQQDKNNAFFWVGDTICITYPNGKKIKGTITCVDIKKEGDKLHPIMDLAGIQQDGMDETYADCVWIENIAELEIVKFRGER